jgi:hypothetical protein
MIERRGLSPDTPVGQRHKKCQADFSASVEFSVVSGINDRHAVE